MSAALELLIKGGTVFDPAAGLCAQLDVGVREGAITDIAPDIDSGTARAVIDARGCLVTPGLVDLHTHVYPGVSEFGLDPDACLNGGVTTLVDAGSSGAVNFPGLRDYVMAHARTRVLAFVNIALYGVQGRTATELRDLAFADVERAATCLRENPRHTVGIKVRISQYVVGENGIEPLRRALRAASLANSRVMVHIGGSAGPLEDIVDLLRPGDVITHLYTGNRPTTVDDGGQVRTAIWRARDRGVVLDAAHGISNFNFEIARAALAEGLKPQVISTDLHNLSVHGPVFDLPTTMSKFLALGLSLEEVVRAATWNAAVAIGWQDRIGRLEVGREADIAVLERCALPSTFVDADGNSLKGRDRLIARWTIRAGVAHECFVYTKTTSTY